MDTEEWRRRNAAFLRAMLAGDEESREAAKLELAPFIAQQQDEAIAKAMMLRERAAANAANDNR